MSAAQEKHKTERNPIFKEIAQTSVSAVHLYFAPLIGAVRVVRDELRNTPKSPPNEHAK